MQLKVQLRYSMPQTYRHHIWLGWFRFHRQYCVTSWGFYVSHAAVWQGAEHNGCQQRTKIFRRTKHEFKLEFEFPKGRSPDICATQWIITLLLASLFKWVTSVLASSLKLINTNTLRSVGSSTGISFLFMLCKVFLWTACCGGFQQLIWFPTGTRRNAVLAFFDDRGGVSFFIAMSFLIRILPGLSV